MHNTAAKMSAKDFVYSVAYNIGFTILPYDQHERRKYYLRFQLLKDGVCATEEMVYEFINSISLEAENAGQEINTSLASLPGPPQTFDTDILDNHIYVIEVQLY